MPDTNTAQRRMEAGGVIKISDGVTEYTLKLYEPTTFRIKEGWYQPLEFTDRGVIQTPYEGDEQPSEIEFEAKFTGRHAAADIAKHVTARDTSTGLVKLYSLVLDFPDYKGASTGQRLTFATSWLAQGIEYQAGADFDRVKIFFKSKVVQPATATY